MTAHLYEVHLTHYPGFLKWKVLLYALGFPHPTVPIKVAFCWTKRGARKTVEEWRNPTDGSAPLIPARSGVEIFYHGKNGRITDRSTLPRRMTPRCRRK